MVSLSGASLLNFTNTLENWRVKWICRLKTEEYGLGSPAGVGEGKEVGCFKLRRRTASVWRNETFFEQFRCKG